MLTEMVTTPQTPETESLTIVLTSTGSYGDRYGCADLDGDGWSNLNDFAPLDESQWVDEDEDGFGDNSSGYLGDQCPGVAGVENGEGGDGCPPPFVDTDGDGYRIPMTTVMRLQPELQ